MPSYRGPSTANLQASEDAETDFLGRPELAWLLRG
jgi:alkaline phosphatase D